MKKIIYFLMIMLNVSIVFTSCKDDDDDKINTDTISEVHQLNNPLFIATSVNSYFCRVNFSLDYDSDHLLIYRQTGNTATGAPVWTLIPVTYYNSFGSIGYNFDFSREDFSIYVDSDYDIQANTPELLNNQVFRIVIIPGYFPSSKNYASPVDYNDYNAVIKYYKIDESKVKIVENAVSTPKNNSVK